MTIPVPSGTLITGHCGSPFSRSSSRFVTTFTPLYLLDQGLRASLLPAINLQISEFSLVVMALGWRNITLLRKPKAWSVRLCPAGSLEHLWHHQVRRTYQILISALKRAGLRDLDTFGATKKTEESGAPAGHKGGGREFS